MKFNFAKRMSYIKASEIREILKVTEQEDVISFAGGLPAPELFPIEEINEINQIVLREAGTKALQYTTTEGYALVVVGKSASMVDFSFLKKKWQNSLDLLTEKVA